MNLRSPQARGATETRRLRVLVQRLQSCLTVLSPLQRRVLSLRAGLTGRPRSVAATARSLHISQRREQRVEHQALNQLQTSVATGCAGPISIGASATPMSQAGFVGAHGVATPATGAGATASGTPAPASRAIRTAARSASAAHPRHHAPKVTTSGGGRVMTAGAGSSFPLAAIPALAALALGFWLLALSSVRRRLTGAPATVVNPGRTTGQAGRRPQPGPATGNTGRTTGAPSERPQPGPASPPQPERLWRGPAEIDPQLAGTAAAAYASFSADSPAEAAPSGGPSPRPPLRRRLADQGRAGQRPATAAAVSALAWWRSRQQRRR